MRIFEKKPTFFVAIAVIFFAILLVVFRDFAFDSNQLMLNSDQLNGIGSRILRAESALVTEWDDSRLGGVPTIDALFADVYHPLVWTQFVMDPARAVGFKFILTLWVAFMSAFALGWHLTKNKWWGALLGLLYAFAPEFFTYIYGGHDGKMMVFAIAPLALLAIRKVVRTGSIPYMIVLALSVAWMILGSHLQLTYLFLWGAGLYTLYEVAFHCDALKTRGKRLGLAAVGLAFGLALSCFQIVPPYLYTTTQSVRGDDSHTNYGHAVSWSLHQEEMAQMILPGFVGVDVYEQNEKTNDLEGSSFVNFSVDEYRKMGGGSPFYWGHNSFKLDHNNAGALLTFLGFLCLFLPGKRRYAAFWGVGAVVALSYGMGDHSPLFKLWYNVLPGVKSFRAPGMALFWLPLLLVMMAGPVLKALTAENTEVAEGERSANDDRRALLHGTAMYAILLVLVLIARFAWTAFIGPVGLVVMVAYAVLCLGVMSLDDQKKPFSMGNLMACYSAKLPGTSRVVQTVLLIAAAYIGVMLISGQKLLEDAVTAPYFKPLNEAVMEASAGKVVPGFILILVIVAATWFVVRSKLSVHAKALILAAVAGVELFVINGVFIQNVPAKEYLQPDNAVVAAYKNNFKADSLNTPRVLSLSRSKALSANSFPQYNLRNADGVHDNELASYRAFRGGQQDANYLMNINDQDAAHPFLDLMNVGAIFFDGPRGTTFMWNPTFMGEAYLYGEAVVMNDDEAIATLKDKAAIRSEKIAEPEKSETVEVPTDSAAVVDSAKVPESAPAETKPQFADEDGKFFYREKVILSEAPAKDYKGSVAATGPIQGKARLVERPKMDTQVFEVESDRPGFMVVAGNYHPYWKAYVNGSEAKVYKAFGTLRAVEIPQGKSQVRMEYRSEPFHKLVYVSFAAGAILIVLCAFALVRRKK
ncbi:MULTISPECIES: hypothetical protein [unclassified Fibrobacter]|uniref:hypothetical protein n=1 Tax=unclassified Fibrobacter TaxID=2634177 RepID=UPI000D7AB4CA|nr:MULTISPECIES: hypothetical protein [unclassified Fibrobacter]PWJ69039.1 hypothetical protein BGX12_1052 [Fibrobacter sp. UWR4]PZW72870.1 hypothetical protein C8E88_10052 [Fibrobacter sp. UWR1]